MINLLKQLVKKKQGLISSSGQVDAVLPMLFVASYSYNKTRANTHATVIKLSFGHFFVQFMILKTAK